MRLYTGVLALGLSLGWSSAGLANEFVGVWMTDDGKGQVRLSECGDRLCSEIVWLRETADERGRPLRDHMNPDPNLRDRPIIGLEILQGLTRSGRGEYAGHIYNPENGRTYQATLRLADRNTMRLKGCTAWGWPCGEQTWTRSRPRAPAQQVARAGVAEPSQRPRPQAGDRAARAAEPPQQAAREEPSDRTQTAALPRSAPAASGDGYHVQIAARQSQQEAMQAFDILRRQYPSLLGSYSPNIEMADLGPRGVWYRVRVGPLGERRAAEALCDRMKAAGGDCLVRNP